MTAGIWVPWLADAARLTGYPVVEVEAWRTRGRRGFSALEVLLDHHTGGPGEGEAPSLRVVRDGRAGLAGPLGNLVLGRSATIYVVAAGVANHAGVSEWLGFADLNSRSLGIEAEDDGDGRWTAEQLDCYPRLNAALLHYMRRDASRLASHEEAARPRGRKVDPAGIDMPDMRRHVAQLLTDPVRLIPRTGAPPALVKPAPAPTARSYPPLAYGVRNNPRMRAVQRFLARRFSYAKTLPATGNYLEQTVLVVREFQHRAGVHGPDANGQRIGPRTWAALIQHGFPPP